MKKEFIFSMLLAASLPAAAAHHGRVFVDKNHNGSFDKGEKVLKDVKVSDGLNVVKTDANGMYTLPGHERERFVFITLPSGYKAGDKHYHPITAAAGNYDFGLIPYQAGIDKKGAHRFIQVSDMVLSSQGPTRIGPRRHWNAAQTFRSMNIIMIAITA